MSDALTDTVPVEQDDRNEWLIALVIVLLLINGNANRPLSPAQRKRVRDLLRIKFEMDATRNAVRVTNGLPVDEWQLAVGAMVADYIRQMAVAGAGTLPSAAVQQAAFAEIQRQAPFLAGFASAITQGMSQGAIAARTKLYGAPGWAMYHVAQGSIAGDGIVEQWISRDDRNTCAVCSRRSGQFYLPGVGPMPASDCYGFGACRCERIQIYDPQMWARLSGRRAA